MENKWKAVADNKDGPGQRQRRSREEEALEDTATSRRTDTGIGTLQELEQELQPAVGLPSGVSSQLGGALDSGRVSGSGTGDDGGFSQATQVLQPLVINPDLGRGGGLSQSPPTTRLQQPGGNPAGGIAPVGVQARIGQETGLPYGGRACIYCKWPTPYGRCMPCCGIYSYSRRGLEHRYALALPTGCCSIVTSEAVGSSQSGGDLDRGGVSGTGHAGFSQSTPMVQPPVGNPGAAGDAQIGNARDGPPQQAQGQPGQQASSEPDNPSPPPPSAGQI